MSRFTMVVLLGLALGPSAFADDYSWKEQRQAECTERANDRQMTNRQEFVDFCVAHNDAEVQRYWDCAPKADKRDLGTDTRRSFLDWCVKEENFTSAEANKFADCSAQASQQNLTGDTREAFVNRCVERAAK